MDINKPETVTEEFAGTPPSYASPELQREYQRTSSLGMSNLNWFAIVMVLFMGAVTALNWSLLYLLEFKKSTNFDQEMKIALALSIIALVFLILLIFGLFVVWRYDRFAYISHMDRVTYVAWLVLTITTFISMVMNFWTFAKLQGTITQEDLDNARKGSLWAATIFTSGVAFVIAIYAIRGFKAQQDNGLFYRSIQAMKEKRKIDASRQFTAA